MRGERPDRTGGSSASGHRGLDPGQNRRILEVYDAVGRHDSMLAAMGQIATDLECENYGLLLRDAATMRPLDVLMPRAYAGAYEVYRRVLYRIDTVARAAHEQAPGRLFDSNEMVARDPVHRTIMMAQRRLGQAQFVGTWFPYDAASCIAVAFARPIDAPPFSPEDKERLEPLLGHLCRAAALHFRITSAHRSAELSSQLLDGYSDGILVLDDQRFVMETNAPGRALVRALQSADIDEDGRFAVSDPELDRLLARHGDPTQQDPPADRTPTTRAAWCARASGRPVLVCVLDLDIDESDDTVGERNARTGVIIIDPQRRAELPLQWLRERYGLSPREAEVAAALARGLNLEEIAAELGNSVGTIRNQLKQVFNKTGVHSQPQLVSKLLTTAPALAL